MCSCISADDDDLHEPLTDWSAVVQRHQLLVRLTNLTVPEQDLSWLSPEGRLWQPCPCYLHFAVTFSYVMFACMWQKAALPNVHQQHDDRMTVLVRELPCMCPSWCMVTSGEMYKHNQHAT